MAEEQALIQQRLAEKSQIEGEIKQNRKELMEAEGELVQQEQELAHHHNREEEIIQGI